MAEWESNQTCDICKKDIGDGDYWYAIRQDGKKVAICKPCQEGLTEVEEADAPPFPDKTWSPEDN